MIILTSIFIGLSAGFVLGYIFARMMADTKTECCRAENWSNCFEGKDEKLLLDIEQQVKGLDRSLSTIEERIKGRPVELRAGVRLPYE